ncbi:MAG: hypothetical protein ACNA77_07320 [Opitutales bacterium]
MPRAGFLLGGMEINRNWHFFYFARLLLLFVLGFNLLTVFASAQKGTGSADLTTLSVGKILVEGGDYTDFFVKLKLHPEFARLAEKHRLDDPAQWTILHSRFVLNLAELQGMLTQAKSMMEAKDRRSGLDGKMVSSESVRERGRARHEILVKQMDELRQMLRLIDEMESALAEVGPLVDKIDLENKAGQSLVGQVLFIDGEDLIIKRAEASYFRVPSAMLNYRTKLKLMTEIFSEWGELPGMKLDPYAEEGEDREELIAYDDARLFIKEPSQGVFSRQRNEGELSFVPYATQLESAREVLSQADRKDREIHQATVDALEKASALNQSRVETIQWYESRIGFELPSM